VNGVFRYQTGRPVTVGGVGDTIGNGRGSRRDFFGDPADFSFYSPDDAPAVFHPGGPDAAIGSGSANCSLSSPFNTCVGTANFNRNVAAGTLYTTSDLAINTPECRDNAQTATHLARLQANGCWTRNGSAILPADIGSFGNFSKGLFSGPAYWNLDFSVAKRQRITERINTEFRAEFFNLLNHPNFGNPSTSVACSATSCQLGARSGSTPDVGATNPVLGSGGPRRMQLGVKISF
jgi:hypothetical protein